MAARRQEALEKKITAGIGNRIREARNLIGLTQQSLADRSGHSKSQIAQWEIGVRTPGIDGAFSLASTMKISFLWLATGLGELQTADQEERQPRLSSSLFQASIRFAIKHIGENYPPGVVDPAELAEKLYWIGAKEGLAVPGKTIEECEEILRGAARIRLQADVSRGLPD